MTSCSTDADVDGTADGGAPLPGDDGGGGPGVGQACAGPADCPSGVCGGGKCLAPTSRDAVKNGKETDVDCGSGAEGVVDTGAAACAIGKACVAKGDCTEADCVSGVCAATGADGFKNGNESDVDCGGDGAGTPRCAVGKKCAAPADCANDACMRDGTRTGTCVEARSCATEFGGQTCGAGEVGEAGAVHESCCKSLPVPATFTDRLHPGKRVYLDKYEITAGRMREFITRMEEQYGGEAKIQTWLTTNKPAFWNDSTDAATNWTRWLPEGKSTEVSLPRFNTYLPPGGTPQTDPTGNVGSDWILGPNGYYFYTHGQNCDAAYGYPTYWYPKAVWENVHEGKDAEREARELLDVRSLNCAPPALLAAFCAWDGGQLATVSVLAEVTSVPYLKRNIATCTNGTTGCTDKWFYGAVGRFGLLTENMVGSCSSAGAGCPAQATCPGSPGCPFANYSNDAGQLQYFPMVPYERGTKVLTDYSARIAPPGRITTDVLRVNAGDEPWMDMRGNLQELSLDDRDPTKILFGGVHYDSVGRRPKGAGNQVQPEVKIAQAGARCMRFRDP